MHGFLGPNGSGKTTTIRMLLGLARADSGRMRLFSEPVPRRLPAVIDRIGAVVEQPRFFPGLSGEKNLALLARTAGVPMTRVGEVIEQVGLQGRGQDRYKGYSLGMKQRLAIAATLLKHPDLLMLDEPTNGLDPAGIREIRTMIRDLGARGVTVLLSSHILAEVQQVCDSVSIIGRGRLLASGPVATVVGQHSVATLRVGLAELDAGAGVLRSAGLDARAEEGALFVDGDVEPAKVTKLLADRDLYVSELTPVRATLESVFLELTDEQAEATS